jgi:hypothetical protein
MVVAYYKGFNAAATDEECQVLSAKPTDGSTSNTWQEAVQPHLLLLPGNLFTVGMAQSEGCSTAHRTRRNVSFTESQV